MEKSIIILGGKGSGKTYLLNKIKVAYGSSKMENASLQLLSKLIKEKKVNDFDLYVFDEVNYKTILNYIVEVAKEHGTRFLIASLCHKHDLPEYIKQTFEIIDLRELK